MLARRATAGVLVGVLIVLAAYVAWPAIDALRAGWHVQAVITLGVLAAGASSHAVWCLYRVGTERRGWPGGWLGASVFYVASLIVLVVLFFVSAARVLAS